MPLHCSHNQIHDSSSAGFLSAQPTPLDLRKRVRSGKRAFSLIEIMVGISVLSITLLAIPAAFTSIRKLNFRADSVARTHLVISSQLEELRTQTFDNLESKIDTTETQTISLRGIDYTVIRELRLGSNELAGMIDALVSVSWTESGLSRQMEGRAFFAQNGMSDKKFDEAN